jgi:hypothetical protein
LIIGTGRNSHDFEKILGASKTGKSKAKRQGGNEKFENLSGGICDWTNEKPTIDY